MRKIGLVGVVGFAVFCLGRAYGVELANVDGKSITDETLKSVVTRLGPQADVVKTNPEMRKRLLDNIINRMLITNLAEKAELQKTKDFENRMADTRNDILVGLYYEKYLKDHSTDAQVKAYFEKNKARFSKKEVKASHILIKIDEKNPDASLKKAEQVLADAKKSGADFTALAKKYSEEPNAAQSGGDLGYFTHGRMVKEFEDVAFTMKKGELYSKLVKSQFGYHIIKVTDIRGDDNVDFAAVKPDVERQLREQLGKDLMDDVRKNVKIKVDEKALSDMKF